MIVSQEDAERRLSNPMNLMNRLAEAKNGNGHGSRNSAMSLFGIGKQSMKMEEQVRTIEDNEPKKFVNPFENEKLSLTRSISVVPSAASIIERNSEQQVAERAAESNNGRSPKLDDLINTSESQIRLSLAHDTALSTLNNAMQLMKDKLDDIKPDKLPNVIKAASNVVESIRRERSEAAKNNRGNEVHYHFYTPEQRKIESYEVIEVNEGLVLSK